MALLSPLGVSGGLGGRTGTHPYRGVPLSPPNGEKSVRLKIFSLAKIQEPKMAEQHITESYRSRGNSALWHF